MRRVLLSTGVLFLVAATNASGQSSTKQFTSCPIGSSCDRSYFDEALVRTGAIVYDFFWWTFDGTRRASVKGPAFSSVLISQGSRSAESDSPALDWRTEANADARSDRVRSADAPRRTSGSDDLERTNAVAFSWWDWLESMRAKHPAEFADEAKKPDGAGEKRADSDAPRRARGDDIKPGNGGAKPDRGDHNESPKNNDDVLDGALTPEPSTLLLIGSGLPLALAFVRRRRR